MDTTPVLTNRISNFNRYLYINLRDNTPREMYETISSPTAMGWIAGRVYSLEREPVWDLAYEPRATHTIYSGLQLSLKKLYRWWAPLLKRKPCISLFLLPLSSPPRRLKSVKEVKMTTMMTWKEVAISFQAKKNESSSKIQQLKCYRILSETFSSNNNILLTPTHKSPLLSILTESPLLCFLS